MIILIGSEKDPVMKYFGTYLYCHRYDFLFLNQAFLNKKWHFKACFSDQGIEGFFNIGNDAIDFKKVSGIYARLVSFVCEDESERLAHSSNNLSLKELLDVIPCRVVNRPVCMGSNSSKPYQLNLLQHMHKHAVSQPMTYLCNKPVFAHEYLVPHTKKYIYKSISGIRSIVSQITGNENFSDITNCPTQFQKHVDGDDIRVHVVGNEIFPVRIRSSGVDYRYSSRVMKTIILEDSVKKFCIKAVKKLGLLFAGVDMLITNDGYCLLEVNPSPGYTFYEQHPHRLLTKALVRLLLNQEMEL